MLEGGRARGSRNRNLGEQARGEDWIQPEAESLYLKPLNCLFAVVQMPRFRVERGGKEIYNQKKNLCICGVKYFSFR